jgi:hypothetical protein
MLESAKRAALATSDGRRGDRPVPAVRAEQDLVLLDESRDDTVPAGSGNRRAMERAVSALPAGVEQVRLRADKALHEHEGMQCLHSRGVGFAISADICPSACAPRF